MKRPKQRSYVRKIGGSFFYLLKKKYRWHLSNVSFGKQQKDVFLSQEIAIHNTILLRELKDIDRWMQINKIKNISLALRTLNGIILNSGESFSYWRSIGRPTVSKGYVPGMVLHDGKVESGIGGGLCQLSNLIYWITLHTPLTVVERHRHGYDVFPDANRTQPFGSGATCSYPGIDLEIRNDTTQPFQLLLTMTKTHLVGKWLSSETIPFSYTIYEKEHAIHQEWWGGYIRHNTIYRTLSDTMSGDFVRDEFVTENNAIMMYDPLLK